MNSIARCQKILWDVHHPEPSQNCHDDINTPMMRAVPFSEEFVQVPFFLSFFD
jgi:hypothetical protein